MMLAATFCPTCKGRCLQCRGTQALLRLCRYRIPDASTGIVSAQGIAECICRTVLHLLNLMAPPAPAQQSPLRLGLPSASQDSLRDLLLSVLVSACERTSSWQSFREHALEFYVKRWRQDVSASVDRLCSQEWHWEGFNIEEAAVELPTGTTTNYVKMMSKYLCTRTIHACLQDVVSHHAYLVLSNTTSTLVTCDLVCQLCVLVHQDLSSYKALKANPLDLILSVRLLSHTQTSPLTGQQ